MVDFVISSNQSSVILRSLAEAEVMPLEYEIAPSYPLLGKQYKELQTTSGAAVGAMNGQEIAFNINKSMLLRDMMIKTTFTTTTTTMDTAVEQMPGLMMYEWIQLRTNNKVIQTMSDSAIIARVEESSENVKTAIYRRALPLVVTTEVLNATSTSASVTYTPVFSSFFEDTRNNFDLNFYEQLSLNCKFNTTVKAGFLATTTTIGIVTLWVWTYRPDDKYYDYLRSKNQNPAKPLNMLTWNTYTERQACVGTTTQTMRLNVNYPVFKTYVMLKPILAVVKGQFAKIDSIEFSVGGTKLLENVPNLVARWESEKTGSSGAKILTAGTNDNAGSITNGTYGYDDNKAICFNWGLLPQNYVSNSGAVSFSQINYPQIIVNHQTITAANYEVSVVHYYWNILTLDSSNGSVNVTVAS